MKNALANVVRGSSSSLVALLMPPFLIRYLSTEEFSVWVLILQLSTYSSYLDFGIQTAVGRFVAYTNELGDKARQDRIVNTAFAFLTGSAILAIFLVMIVSWQLPSIFQQLPEFIRIDAQLSLLLIGISTALALPASVFIGVFIGFQRFEIPAIIVGGGKLISGILIIVVAGQYAEIVPMAAILAAVNLLTYYFQYTAYLNLKTKTVFSINLINKDTAKELYEYCSSVSIWLFAMLLITGLDTTLVAWFDFKNVAYYGIAANLILLISGLQNAIFNVLIPSAAILGAQEKAKELGRLLILTTRYGMLILVLTGLPLIAFGKDLTALWLGSNYSEKLTPIIQILVVANIIRLSAVPYATLLMGTGQQRLIILSPLLEGSMNLIASIVLGKYFGALGIASGTLIGALFGICGHLFYNMKITMKVINFKIHKYLTEGIVKPLQCSIPLLLITLLKHQDIVFHNNLMIYFELLAIMSTFLVVWQLGLTPEERKSIIKFAKDYNFNLRA
jgi:O-antigen/teichoic acid export membrane protein